MALYKLLLLLLLVKEVISACVTCVPLSVKYSPRTDTMLL